MSLALYRKYRPATFAELKGQEHVAEPLQQALRNGRINHAYLFSGPRGCGKTSSARILARSLNCEKGPTPDPCGVCESCVALGPSGAGHIDVIEIDAASHGGVDDARDLRERAFFAPVAARYKIYIIDEAHMVTREGFNALLKLVEEPPPHLKFIFATTEPEKVIGTIRSRTHHYPFRLIPPGTLRELLEEILQKEAVPYEPAAIPLVVRAGAGSARDSESILDQLLAGSGEEGITYARAVSLLGYTDSALLDEVVDAVASHDGAAVFAAIDRVMEGGQDPRRFAADLLERFRDLVILSNVPDSGATGLLNVPPDELERMQAQASRLGSAELTRAADLLHTGLTEMRGATSPRLLLELISARILLPGAYDDEASLLTRLERLERRVAVGGAAPAAAPMPHTPQTPAASAPQPSPVASSQPPPAQGRPQSESPQARVAAPPEADRPQPSAAHGSQATGQTRTSQGDRRPPGGDGPAGVQGGSADWPVPARPSSGGQSSGRPSEAGPASSHGQPSASTSAPGQSSGSASSYGQSASEPSAAPSAPAGGVDVAAIRRMWPDILEAVKQRSKVAWIVLMEGVEVASLQGEVLTLAFANEGKRRGFTTGGKDAVLRDALKEILGVEWRIDAVLEGGSGQASRPAPPPPDPGGWGAPATPPRETRTTPPPESAPVPPPSAPPPPPPEPVDEADEVDPEGDADADSEAVLTGMALIEQVLGGKVIQEFDNT
ncbi:DNA polymerase III subunit gamma and tau [Actinoallomurus sp. CA-150999]|uniref:DNA polymerase III subunit gamma and tau n=1 Tax=Actinoallomurus sp. CA-150999 TaxID=3239887 RepID=UPI003D917F2E